MNDKPSVMKTVIIEDEKAAVRNLTSLLNEVKPEAEIIAILDSINSTIEWFDIHPMAEIGFMDIPALVEKVMQKHTSVPIESFVQLLAIDRESRIISENLVKAKH
mgnify:CR=1 FL=1